MVCRLLHAGRPTATRFAPRCHPSCQASHDSIGFYLKKSRGRVNAPTHRLHPPLLPILYPHLKKAGAPPVESLRQRAQHDTRPRWNLPISRYTPRTPSKHANASSTSTNRPKTTAKPHDDATPPHNSCASGFNATNNTANKDCTTCPKPPNANPEKPTPT